ncbi:CapA family protein [Natrialbaceae archaeon AArc-T1-2]|uniref:CapA family protein n=1 Tax=Natrialbaceae archaeon AArc-T1-2 TaxID=3053904 RepID=UPI00255AECC3|nr:CapA family protein [Natrialbaceae archaeon AArc-T1-2]WIV67156.1 CapA family protein [Natrialbaceae archaeon AArc-T1-2]
MTGTLRFGLTGDVMLGRLVDERYRTRDVSEVWGDVRERLRSLDALAINLECALSTRGSPWSRTHRPFHFRADPSWAVPALTDAGVSFAALANNHVLDFEEPAMRDTLEELSEAGIAHAGAGRTEGEAFAPATIEVDGVTIAFVSLTDNTPEYAVGPDEPGTAYVPIGDDDDLARERAGEAIADANATEPDLLVASLHWGPNMVTEPPPEFRRFARFLVDEGVDLVHGHSAHVFQGIEVIDDVPVLYDCGDFVDDYAVDHERRNDRSFLFTATLESETGSIETLRLFPTMIERCTVYRATEPAASWSRDRMRELSEPFGTSFERDGEELVLDLRG